MGSDLERGKRVGHLSYGLGTVVTVSDSSRFTVELDSGITLHGLDREQFDAFYDPAEFERTRRAAEEVQDLRELFEQASADPLPRRVSITPPPPGDDDWQLVRCWCTPSETTAQDSEERRMLSARLAEKAVASFFLNGGHSVDDISIGQLSSAESDWRIADLRVGQRLIDVKNARRSEKNPDRYVSHCVAEFKEGRNLEAVEVAGALSHWLTVDQMRSGAKPVLFLGMTTYREVTRLQQEFASGPLILMLRDGLTGPSFLPPWIFNYPDSEYLSRSSALEKLRTTTLPDWNACRRAGLNPIAGFLAAGRSYHQGIPLSRMQERFATRLLFRVRRFGLSLPVVFLTLMEHFLTMLSSKASENFVADNYAELIFPTEKRDRPLFIYDPLRTVDTLLSTLSTLWETRTSELREMSVFHLHDLNILLGKRKPSETHWRTVLAYCGGWTEGTSGRKPCGTTPLVLGECRSCVCRRLICPNCGYCTDSCKAGMRRMIKNTA